jgi:hypothetical protein
VSAPDFEVSAVTTSARMPKLLGLSAIHAGRAPGRRSMRTFGAAETDRRLDDVPGARRAGELAAALMAAQKGTVPA